MYNTFGSKGRGKSRRGKNMLTKMPKHRNDYVIDIYSKCKITYFTLQNK